MSKGLTVAAALLVLAAGSGGTWYVMSQMRAQQPVTDAGRFLTLCARGLSLHEADPLIRAQGWRPLDAAGAEVLADTAGIRDVVSRMSLGGLDVTGEAPALRNGADATRDRLARARTSDPSDTRAMGYGRADGSALALYDASRPQAITCGVHTEAANPDFVTRMLGNRPVSTVRDRWALSMANEDEGSGAGLQAATVAMIDAAQATQADWAALTALIGHEPRYMTMSSARFARAGR